MPYQIRRQTHGYAIQRKLRGGGTRTVGHSTTRTKAQRSINARHAGAHGAKLSGRGRTR